MAEMTEELSVEECGMEPESTEAQEKDMPTYREGPRRAALGCAAGLMAGLRRLSGAATGATDQPCIAGVLACGPALSDRSPRRARPKRSRTTPINDAVRESFRQRSSCSTSEALQLSTLRLNYDPTRSIPKTYTNIGRLGGGSFGTVFHVQSTTTGQDRAMKVLPKKSLRTDTRLVQTEIEAMLHLDHPNVVKYYESLEDPKYICIVTELCSGGDFNELRHGKCSMEEVRVLYRDVMTGVAYCHSLGIAHRDLKFDNCLLEQGPQRRVGKVIDFGLSAIRREGLCDEWLSDQCGTCLFVAPEVINQRRYGVKVDMWSLGVMLFNLLTGSFPFGENVDQIPSKRLLRTIGNAPLLMEPLDLCGADPRAVHLVKHLLLRDPVMRMDAAAALKHDWLSNSPGTCFRGYVTKEGAANLVERLVSFAKLTRFAKITLMIAAQHTPTELIEDVRSAFLALDSTSTGTLSREDLQSGFAACGYNLFGEELEAVFSALDVDHNDRVSWVEWLSATLSSDAVSWEPAAKEVFNFFDSDGSESITAEELSRVVGEEEAHDLLSEPNSTSVPGTPTKKADLRWCDFQDLVQKMVHERCEPTNSRRCQQEELSEAVN